MKNYITENLFFENNNLYYEQPTKKNKSGKIKLNRNNWHKYMIEYGYQKLELGWKKKLKSEISKNSLWGSIDCGGDGDCLFLCIEEAFKNFNEPENDDFEVLKLREMVSNQINDSNFKLILENYIIEEDTGEFLGEWEPKKINKITDLQNEIKKSGNSFWGDHILIQLLEKALNINIILLNSENEYFNNDYNIQKTGNEFINFRRTIILKYISNVHFELIGYFNGNKMITIFSFDEIPQELKNIYFY